MRFYDAAPTNPAWRLTHIVGSGQSNKFQTAYFNDVQLPNLYTTGQPFPGWYGSWDNTTWTSTDPRVAIQNALAGDASSASTQVIPRTNNAGCVSWGATIFSTPVNDPDKDGILWTWKENHGYTDIATGRHVALTDAAHGQQDVFIQLDHIVDQTTNASFDANPAAITMVQKALSCTPGVDPGCIVDHKVHLHITKGNPLMPGSDAISQAACDDNTAPQLCPYPKQTVTTFRAGFGFLKNQPLNYTQKPTAQLNEADCEANTPPLVPIGPTNCVRRFPPAQKDSYRYGIFADALGAPDWTLQDGSLVSVAALGTTVTITTLNAVSKLRVIGTDPQGNDIVDPTCGNGRVTIVDAITNPALNGTYCITKILDSTHFQIVNPNIGKNTNATYNHSTDPNLGVASGKAGKRSGTSDRGGSGMLISLGSWGDSGKQVTTQAGTILHEMGHLFGLGHGGTYPTNDPNNPFLDEPNCKSNYQSVMNYRFQVDLLDRLDPITGQFADGILDFSKEELQTLNELSLGAVTFLKTTGGADPFYLTTRWYAPPTPSQLIGINLGKKDYVQRYCDGTPISATSPFMYIQQGPATDIKWVDLLDKTKILRWENKQDIDFDVNGSPSGVLRGFNDWANLDMRLGGATASSYVINGGFPLGGGGFPLGGGGFPLGGGGFPLGGGGFPLGGGGFPLGGGASAGDIDFQTANSVTRPPRNLVATEEASPRVIDLSWTAPIFGQIVKYNVYRSDAGAAFHLIGSVSGTTFQDKPAPACNTVGYRYEVTAVIFNPDTNLEQESVPSNTVSTIPPSLDPLTGCYILTGFTSPAAGATFTQGDSISTTWTLQDDFYTPNNPVTNKNANTVLAIGPIPHVGACPLAVPSGTTSTPLVTNGTVNPAYSASTSFDLINGLFTINWNTTPFNAGCYFLELDLDSGQVRRTGPFEIRIFVSDNAPHMTTTSLPPAVVGIPYSATLFEAGGIGSSSSFTWTVVSGALPPGFPSQPISASGTIAGAATLAGTATSPGDYTFMVKVTDSVGNFGTQTLMLHVATPGGLVYVANCTGTCANVDAGTVSGYVIDAASGALIPVSGSPFAAGISPLGVTVDPAARFAYVANSGNNISAYSIDATTGALSSISGSPFATGTGIRPHSVATDPAGQFLYTANQIGNVSGFSINGATGALTPVPGSPFAAGSQPFSVAVDTTGQFAYAVNAISNDISAYSINRTTGALAPAPGSPFAAGPSPFVIVVDPAAPFAYAANFGDNTITAYSIDATTGALTPVSGSPFATGTGTNPRSVTVDPTGQFLYTANQIGNVSGFSINGTTGALTPVPGSPFAAGSAPISVAVDTTGQFAYVANASPSSNNISAYVINRTTGALAPAPGSPFAAGTFPVSVATTAYACAAFPAGLVPFTTIFSITTDSAGDTFVVGGRPAGGLVSALSSVQLPSASNERFCNPVTLETNYTVSAYVPTAAERTGDYSAYAGLTLIDPQTHQQFPNNMIPIDRLDSVFAWRIPPHSSSLTRLSCSLEPTLHSIEGSVPTTIQFANDTAGPVNVYWINYQGQRVFYRGGPFSPLAAGASYVQGTFITHPWIITDVATNSCLGIWLPTESSPGTAVVTGSAPTPAPPQPATNLNAAVQGSAQVPPVSVVLTWNASQSNNVAGYNVYRATASPGPFTKLTSVPTTDLSFTDTAVSSGQTYYYVVTAVDANSLESVYSNEVPAIIP